PFNIVRSVFSLEVRIRGEDHLSYVARAHPLEQLVNTQILRPNALYGRNRPVQYMIEPLVGAGLLQRQQIKRLFYDTDQLLNTIGIATNSAGIGLGNVKTARTIDDAFLDAHDSFCQAARLVGRTAQDEESQALRGLHTDTRQF